MKIQVEAPHSGKSAGLLGLYGYNVRRLWESESLAETAANECGFSDLVIRAQTEHRLSRSCAVDGEILVPCATGYLNTFPKRLIHLNVGRAIGRGVNSI